VPTALLVIAAMALSLAALIAFGAREPEGCAAPGAARRPSHGT
jgi:hypothetical protein